MKTVLSYLQEDPRFRERKNKNKGIANLISMKYGIEIPNDKRDDIVADILNMDRQWRKCLEEDETLRGKDYDVNNSKTILEQKKMLELGYQTMHGIISKELNKL